MRSTDDLARMFDYGAQLYPGYYPATPPTEQSIARIESALNIRLPRELVEFARLSRRYGTWFASIGDDYANPVHILDVNAVFHDQCAPDFLPPHLIVFNHGYDGDCDCFDNRSLNENGEHPLFYASVSESSNPGPSVEPVSLADSFRVYLESLALRMQADYQQCLKRKKKTAQPGATDNPDDAQRLREDH